MRGVIDPERRRLIDPPWLVKIELTEGCNLRCKFCPVSTRPEFQGPKVYMTRELAGDIGFQLAMWKPEARIEFTMRGEPTLNPEAAAIIATLRSHLPKAQMSMFTNGTTWLKDEDVPDRLFAAGLNILNVDCYNGTYDRFKAKAQQFALTHDVELSDFRQLSAYSKIPRGWKRRIINLVPDIADPEKLVAVRSVHNMAGNLSREQEERFGMKPTAPGSVEKKCGRPFRELAILQDGRIVVCCLDWSAKDVLGTVQGGIEEAWYGDLHHRIMVALYAKQRGTTGACSTCNYNGGMRLGLLRNPTTGASYRDKTAA